VKFEAFLSIDLSKMSSRRIVKHFVVTVEKGSIQIAKAREIVPNRTYEVIQSPPVFPSSVRWNFDGIGLGEHTVKEASLSLRNFTEDATECKAISKRQNTYLYSVK
jgi:hypothetical protein